MIVRRLLPEECDAFWEIRLQSLRDCPEAYGSAYEEEACLSSEERKARCDWSDDNFVIGAFEGERLVGIVGLRREIRVKSRHKAVVIGMYVLPEFRAQGLGGLLMDKLIQEARQLPSLARLGMRVRRGFMNGADLWSSASSRMRSDNMNSLTIWCSCRLGFNAASVRHPASHPPLSQSTASPSFLPAAATPTRLPSPSSSRPKPRPPHESGRPP